MKYRDYIDQCNRMGDLADFIPLTLSGHRIGYLREYVCPDVSAPGRRCSGVTPR